MVSSSFGPPSNTCFRPSRATAITACRRKLKVLPPVGNLIGMRKRLAVGEIHHQCADSPANFLPIEWAQKSVLPLAASLAVLLCSTPADAGILSGFPGIESVPGPELPQVDFLAKFNEQNQKRYAENDARFKESPLLKQLLERSKLNKEKNKQAIQDKYCLRGAEWGIGDCSAEGMTMQEREDFIAALKKKAGVE